MMIQESRWVAGQRQKGEKVLPEFKRFNSNLI
jgi:hypothetical protein